MKRMCLLGGESSGKTTLARALAQALGTVWVPEYGRQRWEELRETLSVSELVLVAQRQIELEDEAALRATGWLLCDTSPLTTLQYCLADHGEAPAQLHAMAQRHYDLAVLCEPDFDFVQDGCRRDDNFRREQHVWTQTQLARLGLPVLVASGDVEQRVKAVLAAVAHMATPMMAASK
jgi:HTH-type transcriptional regulator, transcriptional repressor of NAD biosynthesis genes